MRALSDSTDGTTSHRRLAAAAGIAAVVCAAAGVVTAGPPAESAGGPQVGVIVEYAPGQAAAAERAITASGGEVGAELPLIGGLSGSVPAGALAALRSAAGIRTVTGNRSVSLTGKVWDAGKDKNSMLSITHSTGASELWKKKDAAGKFLSGQGVGVAVIDSGIAPVKGLADPSRIVNGPDLSFESQAPNLAHLDTFGHGTHMAGIIGGRDPNADGSYVFNGDKASINADKNNFAGMAPGATLISVKVAAADGATDVSQVIAGIDWVVAHRNDPGLNIRVLNLSFGTDSTQDPRLDPLSHAVEAAWRSGIVVDVAAGNDGNSQSHLSMPAQNPYVIAVGAVDRKNTDGTADDVPADFSTWGNANRRPDLLAPGRSVVSLRVPNSYVDYNYPTGRITDDPTQRFFRGSGTSQATAIMSGAAALLLQQRPTLTPDQVKALLTSTAIRVAKGDPLATGAGQLNLKAAADAKTPVSVQSFPASTGTGSLERSRGSAHVADPVSGAELTGETDIFGKPWTGASWAPLALTGRTWSGGSWNGGDWTGTTWAGSSWAGRTWSGRTWSGRTWSDSSWSGRTWSGAVWDGRTWSGRTWAGRSWSGATWDGGYWSGAAWK